MSAPLLAFSVMLAALPGPSGPRLATFTCEIGEGRSRLFPSRAREENADDELQCRASLRGLKGRSATDLIAELRVLPPAGPFRVVASQPLSATDSSDGARLQGLIVPSSTWVSAVDWRAKGGPRIRMELRILDKPGPGQKRWRVVASRNLELRH
jgi:hypothetical protein